MTKNYYDPLSRLLHWLMAVVILYATLAGYLMHLVIDSHPRLFQFLSVLNMSMATLITPLFLLRWGWQHLRTPLPESEAGHYHGWVKLAHALLYGLMFVVLLSGFLMLEQDYALFWLYPITNPIDSPEINAFFFRVHRLGCLSLAALVLLHVAAALYHHGIKGDRTLYRMLGPRSGK
ncbi:cytochrome b [Aeromonas eucrenophila]|uniref:Cytochrome b n=1 Tax=Aeromonas eucrenophila TaxID=649 RepID=A0ABW0Y8H8_9GAMM|nr:cytochrome b/b6 domain-containing protein [Aeromonas eucrenophila]